MVTRKDIGRFTNNEGVILSQDSDTGELTLNTESAPSNLEADNYLFAITQDGPLLLQVTAVDANAKTVTVDRPVDGTADVDMVEGARLVAAVPARAVNRLAAEQVAMQAWLGKDGDTITWDRNLVLQPSTTDGTYPLSIEVLSGHADPEPFIQFRRSTDGGTNYTVAGSIDYDPANDELEIRNIVLTAAAGADILLEDDRSLFLGTDRDARFLYVSADDRVEYRSNKVLRFEKADESEALTLTPGTRLNLVGAFAIGGTDVLEADRDVAIDLLPNATAGGSGLDLGSATRYWDTVFARTVQVENQGAGSDPALTSNDATQQLSLTGDLAFVNAGAGSNPILSSNDATQRLDLTGALDISDLVAIGGTTVFEADRDQAVSWVPNADNSLTAGTATRRYSEAHAVQFDVEASAGDANPVARLTTTGLLLGAGGASALDGLLKRDSSSQWALRNAADSAYIGLDVLELTVGGTAVLEADRDLAVDLIPNATGTLDLGSTTRNFQDLFLTRAQGSVLFVGANGLVTEDNANFVWDNTNKALTVKRGTAGPTVTIENTGVDSLATLALKNDAREWRTIVDGSDADKWVLRDETAATDRVSVDSTGLIAYPDFSTGSIRENHEYRTATNAYVRQATQRTTGVSTTPVPILDRGTNAPAMRLVYVHGDDGTSQFADLLNVANIGTAGVNVIDSITRNGPPPRTYTATASGVELSLGSGTFTVIANSVDLRAI